MEELLRELEQSAALRAYLESRIPKNGGPGCSPNCFWIWEDLQKHGKLTGYPLDYNDQPDYPIDSKIKHLHVELVGPYPEHLEDGMELLPAVVERLREMSVRN